MSILSQDYLQLKQLKIFLEKNNSIKVNEIDKHSVGQMLLNNKFFHDFDDDGEITFADYNIAWNWLMQGKPTEQEEMLTELKVKKLPYEYLQNREQNILLDNKGGATSKAKAKTTKYKRKITSFSKKRNIEKQQVEPTLVTLGSEIKSNNTTLIKASSTTSISKEKKEANQETNAKDFSELNHLKKHLKQTEKTDLDKKSIGQSMLNNKFFDDFTNDGKVGFADFNVAWNWILQGKPTDKISFRENAPKHINKSEIPYQFIQNTSQAILYDNRGFIEKEVSSHETKRKVFSYKMLPNRKPETKKQDTIILKTNDSEGWKNNYFNRNERIVSAMSTDTTSLKKDALSLISTDYLELEKLKEFLIENNEIEITEISKRNLSQKLLNNKFFNDFDMDGKITFNDYNIAWNWVMQGKPTDIVKFAKNKSATPDTRKIPYQNVQDLEYNILADNRLVVYDRGDEEGDDDTDTLISALGLSMNTGVEVVSTGISEASSDFNEDGEVDETDLDILECFILSRPKDICEYNRDRPSECPEATKLPNMLTAKFACDTSYYYGDVHLPGDDIIQNADVEYYMAWLHGDVPVPDRNTLKFILSNNWIETPYKGPNFREVLRDCNIRDQKTEMTLHSTSIYRVDYRDYLIMKEWIRLGKPNFKGKQSDYDALAWFNANSKEGTPIACKLPFEVYMDIGATCYTFEDTYIGAENL